MTIYIREEVILNESKRAESVTDQLRDEIRKLPDGPVPITDKYIKYYKDVEDSYKSTLDNLMGISQDIYMNNIAKDEKVKYSGHMNILVPQS